MSDAAGPVPLLCLRPTCREPLGASGRFVLAVGPVRFYRRVTLCCGRCGYHRTWKPQPRPPRPRPPGD